MNDELGQKLIGKEYSPLILRRYSVPILHWIAIICDSDLSRLDSMALEFWKTEGLEISSIQAARNLAGRLQKNVIDGFEKIEGVAVILSCDKMIVSSLYGDFMNHLQCRLELYSLLNLSTNI